MRRDNRIINIVLIFLCVILIGVLGALVFWNVQKSTVEQERLEQLSKDSREEEKKEEKKQQKEESEDTEDTADEESATEETSAPETAEADTAAQVEGIVCWGDDLMDANTTATSSYMAVLQGLLQQNGYNLPVINKTLQGGGTLSMMKMAGVDDQTLQNYITAHQQAANGAELYITETGIRDLTAEQTERNDLNCIPVIFMGYYGGWNHDVNELAEQQQRILDTFPNKDRYIIVGTRPVDEKVDSATLDAAMSQKWGDHYISLASVTSLPASSAEAQSLMAQAVFQKLIDLSYISSGQVN